MTPMLLGMAGWIWTTTTVIFAVVTTQLCGVLVAYCTLAVLAGPAGRSAGEQNRSLRRALRRSAVPIVAGFVIVALIRAGIILHERHGP